MISNTLTYTFLFALLATTLFPIGLLIFLGVRGKIHALPALLGFGSFFISQIVLRIPLIGMLSKQNWYAGFMANTPLYMAALALSAGVFEESGRLAGALLLKKRRTYRDALSFGLGHGLCEVVLLIGLGHVNNLLFCVLMRQGGVDALATVLSAAQAEQVAAQLLAISPPDVFAGLLERVSAVLFHLFATVLVFQGVRQKKPVYYLLAIAAHTAFNLAGVLGAGLGVWPCEILLLILALAGGWYLLRQRAGFNDEE